MKNLIFCLMAFMLMFSCTSDPPQEKPQTVTIFSISKDRSEVAERNNARRNYVMAPSIQGDIADELGSLEVVSSPQNPNNITWTAYPDTYVHVFIFDDQGYALLQTSTYGDFGFYIDGYVVNRDRNDGNIYIVKGEQYYLYFPTYDVWVPFVIDGRV